MTVKNNLNSNLNIKRFVKYLTIVKVSYKMGARFGIDSGLKCMHTGCGMTGLTNPF